MRFILILFCSLLVAKETISQKSLDLVNNGDWVNVGDLDVPGNQITVEALIYINQFGAGNNVVSKHTNQSNVNYLLTLRKNKV